MIPTSPHRGALAALLLAALGLAAGCLKPDAQKCDSGIYCPSGASCAARQAVCIWDACGNGALDPGEACDDGNKIDGDGCSADCKSTEVCGNDIVDKAVGERCDDGNTESGDGCSSDCKSIEACGNGNTDPGEDCDGGPTDTKGLAKETPICTPTCHWSICGDGYTNALAGETCDGGDPAAPGRHETRACNSDCTISSCGDGVKNATADEECDDGKDHNLESANCLPSCKLNVCGDGFKHATREECDAGAANSYTGACLPGCRKATCGDGYVEAGVEACDTGPDSAADGHTCAYGVRSCQVCNKCQWAAGQVTGFCGDGKQQGDEACDDGNNNGNTVCPYEAGGDCNICNSTCTATVAATGPKCGDGLKNGKSESCDDGDLNGTTYCPGGTSCGQICKKDCSGSVTGGFCGDKFPQAPEVCDDGPLNGSTTCPWSQTGGTCTICNAKCTGSVAGTPGSFCGDGVRDVGNEGCDDGAAQNGSTYCRNGVRCEQICDAKCQSYNKTDLHWCGDKHPDSPYEACDDDRSYNCGTCARPGTDNACQQISIGKASGTLVFSSADLAGVSVTITAPDNGQRVYRFVQGSSTESGTKLDITGQTPALLASALADAISKDAFGVSATVAGTTVTVSAATPGIDGNRQILVQPGGTTGLTSTAMTGGAGCGQWGKCATDNDCLSGLQCHHWSKDDWSCWPKI